jgi:type IV pilus assembly protein PilW
MGRRADEWMLRAARLRGFTLIELLVGMAIGIFLIGALSIMFVSSSQSYGEMLKKNQQLESGRYAFVVLRDDLQHAGFVGSRAQLPAAPATLPDPCDVSVAALATAIALPVQGYDSPSSSPISGCLADADHVPGTDIVVIRRADSEVATVPISNDRYVQASASGIEVEAGNPSGFALPGLNSDNSVSVIGTKADGTVASVLKMMNLANASPTITQARVAADIRKLHVHVYFVAPCSRPESGQTSCTEAADGGTPIPTLKRLELTAGGTGTTLVVRPIAEGIENLQIEYGFDTTPTATNPATGFPGDGVVDIYAKNLTGVGGATSREWVNAMSARIFILARNAVATGGLAEGKTFVMGLEGDYTPTNPQFRRHLFEGEVRLVNQSSRREEPK